MKNALAVTAACLALFPMLAAPASAQPSLEGAMVTLPLSDTFRDALSGSWVKLPSATSIEQADLDAALARCDAPQSMWEDETAPDDMTAALPASREAHGDLYFFKEGKSLVLAEPGETQPDLTRLDRVATGKAGPAHLFTFGRYHPWTEAGWSQKAGPFSTAPAIALANIQSEDGEDLMLLAWPMGKEDGAFATAGKYVHCQ